MTVPPARSSLSPRIAAGRHPSSEPLGARLLPYLLLFAIPVLAAAAGCRYLFRAWDDSAITLSFARTFALHGRIALTAASEQVEGFSSVLWWLLLSLAARLNAEPAFLMAAAKCVAAAGLLAALLYLDRWARALGLEALDRSLALAVFGFSLPALTEVLNGMEMTLAAALFLAASYHLLARSSARHAVLSGCFGSLLLVARFEAPFWLLVPGLLGLADPRKRRPAIEVGLFWIGTFAALTFWRAHTFGQWMPNTVYAKLRPPYHPAGLVGEVASRLSAELELVRVLPAFLLACLVIYLAFRPSPTPPSPVAPATPAAPATRAATPAPVRRMALASPLQCVVFGLFFGRIWGHDGRMVLCGLPFLCLGGALLLRSALSGARGRIPVLLVVAGTSCLYTATALYARARQGSVITTKSVMELGEAVQEVRTRLGRPDPGESARADGLTTAALSDIGGSSLRCPDLRIVDLGGLCNPELARRGNGSLQHVLDQERPGVIEAHQNWAARGRFYDWPGLSVYTIVYSRGIRLFVRNDLADLLSAAGAKPVEISPVGRCGYESPDMTWTGNMSEEDLRFNANRGRALVLAP